MCRLLVSNLECSTHRVLNVVIGTPKASSRQLSRNDLKSFKLFHFTNVCFE